MSYEPLNGGKRGRRNKSVEPSKDRKPVTTSYLYNVITTLAVFLVIAIGLWILFLVLGFTGVLTTPQYQQCGIAGSVPASDACANYLVVGSGTSGSTLAKRLSDDFTQSVLIIEAGSDPIATSTISNSQNVLETLRISFQFPYLYNFFGILKEQASTGLRPEIILGGRGLGGSTLINTQYMVVGTEDYWDSFDEAAGNPGTVNADAAYGTLSQLEWLQTYGHYAAGPERGIQESVTNQFKVASRPTLVDTNDDGHKAVDMFVTAFGLPNGTGTQSYNNRDIKLQANPFAELMQNFNSTNYPRYGVRPAFLGSAVMNPVTYLGQYGRQLRTLMRSTATQLISSPSNPSVIIGVRYTDENGKEHRAWCKNAVIASMNWQTAPFLQRSGIGPASVLSNAGVTPRVINENVGQNWKMHPLFQIAFYAPNMTGTLTDPTGTGTFPGMSSIYMDDISPIGQVGIRAIEVLPATYPSILGLNVWLLDPDSKGSMNISSSDPNQPPIMLSNMLTNSNDLLRMRYFFRRLVSNLTAAYPNLVFLSIDPTTLASDSLLNAWMYSNILLQSYHHFSSNIMGTNSTTGVVNSHGKVFGTTGLYVCDTSIMTPADGNPATPAYLIGDMCARWILQDFGRYTPPSAKRSSSIKRSVTRRSPYNPAMEERFHPSQFQTRAAPSTQVLCAAIEALEHDPTAQGYLPAIKLVYPQCFQS